MLGDFEFDLSQHSPTYDRRLLVWNRSALMIIYWVQLSSPYLRHFVFEWTWTPAEVVHKKKKRKASSALDRLLQFWSNAEVLLHK